MLKRLATNAAALALAGLVAQLAFISIEIAIARHLGSEAFGVFSTVFAIVIACLIVLDAGMMGWQIESGSQRPETIPELWGTTLAMRLIGFTLAYPLLVWALQLLGYDRTTVTFFIVFFPYGLAILGQDSVAAVYTARQRMVTNAIFQGGAPVLIGLLVAVSLWMDYGLTAVGISYAAGGIAVTALWIALAWRTEQPRVRLAESGSILRRSYLYSVTGLLAHSFRKGDILLLSLFTSMSQVGIYAAASKLIDLAVKIPMLGAYVVSPALFQQHQADEILYRRSAEFFVRFSVVSGLAIAVACYLSAEWLILLLFGATFIEASDILRVLSASFALKFIVSALQTVLTTRGQHVLRTTALVAATTAALIGHCVLIPSIGAIGAAISVVIAETLLCLLYLAGVNDRILRGNIARRLLVIVPAAAIAVILPSVSGAAGPFASTLAVGILLTATIATGYFKISEIALLWRGLTTRRS